MTFPASLAVYWSEQDVEQDKRLDNNEKTNVTEQDTEQGGAIGGTIRSDGGTIHVTGWQKELIDIIKTDSKISTRELTAMLNINHWALKK